MRGGLWAGLLGPLGLLLETVESLMAYVGLARVVEQFWLQPTNRSSPNWIGHLEINEVMLATSLAPYGYLEI